MSETITIVEDQRETSAVAGVEAVVGAMSEQAVRRLLKSIIHECIMNGGVHSDSDVCEAVCDTLEQRPFYRFDLDAIMGVCDAAHAAFNLLCGNEYNEPGVIALAGAAVNNEQWKGYVV